MTGSRPLPPRTEPRHPWILFMRWSHLAFLHWEIDPESLREHLPAGLRLDTFQGRAWLGITPFLMSGVRARLTPPVPGLSSFPELNVRTYVSADGTPGIWFLSLDAANPLAVRAARGFYHLPYHRAEMSAELDADRWVTYASARREDPATRFRARYRANGAEAPPDPGSLEHWLVERYCLYSSGMGRLWRGMIRHEPWRLRPAEVEIGENAMARPFGIELPPVPGLVHMGNTQDVVAWTPVPLARVD